MPLVINTNIGSLNAQRQLVKSGMDMSKAMERLSSGLRINKSADDAAGMAISNRMTSQIRGLDQAVRNANDGISLIQTAEGALQESTNILQRMRELAVQSANGIYTATDRASLDAEVQQLITELNRISETTSFNGQQLLDGTIEDVGIQVGINANQTIDISVQAVDADTLGLGSTSADITGGRLDGDAAGNIDLADGDVLINGQSVGAYTNTINNGNLQTLIDDINTNIDGVSASGVNVVEAGAIGTGVLSGSQFLDITVSAIDGGTDVTYTIGNTGSMDELVAKINDAAGGNLTASVSSGGKLQLSNTSGATITVSSVDDPLATVPAASTTANAAGDDAANDVVELSAAPFATGDLVQFNAADGGGFGLDNGAFYYVNNTSGNNYAFYLTAADAVADTNRVDITGAGVATGNETFVQFDEGVPNSAVLSSTLGFTDTGSDAVETFHGQLALTSEDGSAISVTAGAEGTAADLLSLGFRDVGGDGTVTGGTLNAAAQGTALASGDLTINGTAIEQTTVAGGLAEKIEHINEVSDTTGVNASAIAEATFTFNTAGVGNVVEVTGAAYTAPVTGFQTLSADNGFAATDTALGGAEVFDIITMDGVTQTVTLDAATATVSGAIADITAGLAEKLVVNNNNAFLSATDAATTFGGNNFTFNIDDSATNSSTVTITSADAVSMSALVTKINTDIALGAANVTAYVDASGRLAFREDATAGIASTAALTIDTFTNAGSIDTGAINSLMGFNIANVSATTGNGTVIEVFLDQNSAIAFRDTVGGAGDIVVNNLNTGAPAATVGSVNALLGFDLEDLAGSGGAFTGAHEAFRINGVEINLESAQTSGGSISAVEIARAVNLQTALTGVTAYVDDADQLHFGSNDDFTLQDDVNTSNFVSKLDTAGNLAAGTLSAPGGTIAGSIKINGSEVALTNIEDLDQLATDINAAQGSTGVTAVVNDNGELELAGNSGLILEVGQTNGFISGEMMGVNFVDLDDDDDPTTTPTLGDTDGILESNFTDVSLKLTSINAEQLISIEVTDNGATATGLLNFNTDLSSTVTGTALSNIDVLTQATANEAIGAIDSALETVNGIRSDLGAANNRLDFTISNLMNISESTSAARSRIQDADFAAETAALSRAQVLQQASSAMLAQANAQPQQVLSLLR